jgi:hypothetical protein
MKGKIADVRQALRLTCLLSVLACAIGAPAAAAGLGDRCGDAIGVACDAGLWCDPPAGSCGGTGLVGTCVRTGRHCHHNYHPVCGCDGASYGNDCARQNRRVPESHVGKC